MTYCCDVRSSRWFWRFLKLLRSLMTFWGFWGNSKCSLVLLMVLKGSCTFWEILRHSLGYLKILRCSDGFAVLTGSWRFWDVLRYFEFFWVLRTISEWSLSLLRVFRRSSDFLEEYAAFWCVLIDGSEGMLNVLKCSLMSWSVLRCTHWFWEIQWGFCRFLGVFWWCSEAFGGVLICSEQLWEGAEGFETFLMFMDFLRRSH